MSLLTGIRCSDSPSGSKSKVVRFQVAYNLKSLLLDFVTEKDSKLYEDLVCYIRDIGQEIRDDDLTQLLKEARGCVSMLDGNLRLFVQVVLILKWAHRSVDVVSEYQGFLLDLCTAHNYYTKLVIDHLVNSFKSEVSEWENCKPSVNEEKCLQHLHKVLKAVLNVIPMSHEILLASISRNYPYIKKPSQEHVMYIYNLLQIILYTPSLRTEILQLIITKLIALDVHTPRSELEAVKKTEVAKELLMDLGEDGGIFPIDGDGIDTKGSEDSVVAQTLDLCMIAMLKFFHEFCHDGSNSNFIWDKAKALYGDVVKIFDNVILPTHAVHHVQFIIFYFLSFKQALSTSFVQILWRKVTNPNIAPIIRQSAVFYIASLLTRAKYVSTEFLKEVLLDLTQWVHCYIDCQNCPSKSQDTRIHGVFHATCQAVFYIIAFRYRELVHAHKGLSYLESLNLGKVVTCRLNPLKVVHPAVAANFAAVARTYQLAYCYTVMERNSRAALPLIRRDTTGATTSVCQFYLDSFFPFDPYLLPRSNYLIEPIYREYVDHPSESEGNENVKMKTRDEDIDDFLETSPVTHESFASFSYGTSPGFLQI